MQDQERSEPIAGAREAAQNVTQPRRVRHYRGMIFQGYLLVAMAAFAVMAVIAHTTHYFPFDLAVTRGLQTYNAAWFDTLMRAVSFLGYSPQAPVVILTIILILYVIGLRWESVMMIMAALGSFGLEQFFKELVRRPRPGLDLVRVVVPLQDPGFPSGHVVTYVAIYGFLFFLAFAILKPSWYRTALIVLLAALIMLVGPSRIYLGEHWTSDVLAAYLLGSLWLAATVYVYRWGKTRFFVDQPVAPERPRSQA